MIWLRIAFAAVVIGSVPAQAQELQFKTIDIFIDSRAEPLAAYQLEFKSAGSKIVGIEGGDHPAFREQAHYDSKALRQHRVILAAFTTTPATQLPTRPTRVATIHMQKDAKSDITPTVVLLVAGNDKGQRISAEVTLRERTAE